MYIPVNLAVNTFEPANGADETLSPVIFLHGIGASKEMWADIPQIISNRTKRKCFAYDARDHGDSEWTDNFNFYILIDDLLYFMDSKNIKKAIIVGHSIGGWTAGMLALRVPERIELLVLEDSFAGTIPGKMIEDSIKTMCMWQNVLQQVPKDLEESEAIKTAVDNFYTLLPSYKHKYFTKREIICTYKVPIKKLPDGTYDVKHNLKLFTTCNMYTPNEKEEGSFEGPVCIMYGSNSFAKIPEREEEIRVMFPKAEMIFFEGGTHNIHMEFPEKFIDAVINFLTKHLGSSRRYSF